MTHYLKIPINLERIQQKGHSFQAIGKQNKRCQVTLIIARTHKEHEIQLVYIVIISVLASTRGPEVSTEVSRVPQKGKAFGTHTTIQSLN